MDEVKWCFVPTCLNSTKNTVNKWFVPIPVNLKRREIWFRAVNRNYNINSERSTLYCCSDHFNLTEDAGSFMEKNGEIVVKLKKSIVPRLNKPGTPIPSPVNPQRKSIIITAPPNQQLVPNQPTKSNLVNLAEAGSSDEEGDVVSVVTSESSNIIKALLGSGVKVHKDATSPTKSAAPKPVNVKPVKAKVNTAPVRDPLSFSVNAPQMDLMKLQFNNLRRAIPSIASHQELTREKILDEAIEFIIQMRNKSDKRQSSMQYIMESNGSLTARIQHLEHLISLHEKNEIFLTKDIVNRRLGALSATKVVPPPTKSGKQRMKR